ncbi:MAG: hypothetical protein AB7P23_02965 [Amphiplicatus sp.]
MSLAGFALIVYGVIAALSPLPLGLPFVVLGLLMIAGANPAARPLIRRLRARWRWFDRLVRLAGRHAPQEVKKTIDETKPAAKTEGGSETP